MNCLNMSANHLIQSKYLNFIRVLFFFYSLCLSRLNSHALLLPNYTNSIIECFIPNFRTAWHHHPVITKSLVSWLFELNVLLRQYFSLYHAVIQTKRERMNHRKAIHEKVISRLVLARPNPSSVRRLKSFPTTQSNEERMRERVLASNEEENT